MDLGGLRTPYSYGIIIWMKKTLHIDDKLLAEARRACAAGTDTETVKLGLEALVRQAAYARLRALRGSEPDAIDTPRQREKPKRKRSAA
jgi:Arc/MetJ family transcription regulator